jgi:FkbM family methyltransferase
VKENRAGSIRLRLVALLERAAALLRRVGLGFVVDRLAPRLATAFGSFTVEVDGLVVTGATLGHQHYVRDLLEHGRERTLTGLVRAALPPGGIAVDGGAYIGYVTLQAARAVGPTGSVVAFEPDPRTAVVLARNVAANGFADRVRIVAKALGAASGSAEFFVSEAGDTSGLYDDTAAVGSIGVEVVRGDDELAEVARADLVKLDLEGGETAALGGLAGLLGRSGPELTLIVECNPTALAGAGSSADALIGLLEELGFAVSWIDEDAGALVPVHERRWTEGYVNLHCKRGSPA